VNEREHLAEQFEEARPHLLAVAYRILGSASEAEDAVQETWLRLAGSDADAIRNLGGWLTTVVGRVCLDRLRAHRAAPELLDGDVAEIVIDDSVEAEVELAEGVGLALLVVLETLTPAERLAFVLHDMFAVPFEDIAEILGRSPAAARQLASRARRRVRGKSPAVEADLARQREVVEAFLAASREGDFERLIAVLDPDVVFRVHGAPDEQPALSGAAAVARRVLARGSRLAPFGRFAIVDGGPGVVVSRSGRTVAAVRFGVAGGRVSTIDVFADPERLRGLVPVRPTG